MRPLSDQPIPAAAVTMTAVVLLALLGDRVFLRSSPRAADNYHAAVREAVSSLGPTNGQWIGVDVPVPIGAVKMLHPNIILSRRFTNLATSEVVSLLLVHVKDARDTLGHYPPRCYPGQGWKIESTSPEDWSGENREVHGMEYQFSREDSAGTSQLVVDDFMMLPDGRTCRDMDSVERSAQDRKRKFFGAAQVQVVFGGEFPAARRREIVESFLRYAEPAFKVISTGVPHEQ